MKIAYLVYQAGIANVFDDTNGKRVMQADFAACENFCRGLIHAGWTVRVASCNRAGDISIASWTPGLGDCPFREKANPPRVALA